VLLWYSKNVFQKNPPAPCHHPFPYKCRYRFPRAPVFPKSKSSPVKFQST
jgi:hypothetical protein